MTDTLLLVTIALLILLSLQNMVLYSRSVKHDRMQELEDRVQAAMDAAAEEEMRHSRSMDEGFENLMGYQVNLGRGVKTGGEP